MPDEEMWEAPPVGAGDEPNEIALDLDGVLLMGEPETL
jgi:hypothetical protein